jgi:hypothetical protein
MSKPLTVKQAGDLLHALATVRQLENPRESYPAALEAVMAAAENAEIVAVYSEHGGQVRGDEVHPAEHTSLRELGDKVDRLVREYMAANNVKDYGAAMCSVLAAPANTALKEAYAYSRGQS